MKSVSARRARLLGAAAALAATALVLAGCASGNSGSSSKTITIGTTDKITSLDPAGAYDNGSFAVMTQVYPFLFDTPYGSPDVKPDIAESGTFTDPNTFEVKLKTGLKFANGHKLTSSDVKFTFDRQLKIADPNGPSSLLGNLASVTTPDDTTVDFHLKTANDQTFEQVLSSPAGPIVDEQVFSADKVTPDDDIVKGEAFAGQYKITSYKVNQLIQYQAFSGYKGLLAPAKTKTIDVKYYANASNLKLDVQKGAVDVAYRSLAATDIASLRKDKNVKVVDGPGGEIRYIVFNFDTMPFGAKTADADAKKALAVRQAVADVVDRQAIATQVFKDTYTPLYSYVPDGLTGATKSLETMYGDGKGGPDVDKAKATLAAAGITGKVKLNIQFTTDHYGPSSQDEYDLIVDQLNKSGLFTATDDSTEYVQYSKDRVNDVYPEYQLGWFPDYSDADNYLTPFFSKDNFVANHYDDAEVQKLITEEIGTTDSDARTKLIEEIQDKVAAELPTLPLLQGSQVAVVGKDVKGATLDASFKFRYATLSK
ncbi:ABC transporter substrate-binding protein [Gryllotalpicola ginsengisoli]|uniref:ABC transporter substrate-binding protein n=1 Tax=Gryllotalpicola ginsengisoli TaxID=444608 RepID=UPI0003B36519|nr:ABC transporter substrate-binding protein [Gryllotalpicola ginsengisoli]